MPIAQKSYTYNCQTCSWKKTVINPSDCLSEGVNWFAFCPECEGSSIVRIPATRLDMIKERLGFGR